jgi:hypothetical protein
MEIIDNKYIEILNNIRSEEIIENNNYMEMVQNSMYIKLEYFHNHRISGFPKNLYKEPIWKNLKKF